MPNTPHEPSGRVWDPLVRLTHWIIALAVILNGFIIDDDALAHIWIGYIALGMLALRLLWGLIGTESARFSSFPVSFSGAATHVSELKQGVHRKHRSHNPLGALMVYALWATLTVVSVTGVMMESDLFPEDDHEYSSRIEAHDDEAAEWLEDLHEGAANLLLLLSVLHVGGVVLESRLSGRNLVQAMITGRRS
ncbi:cytochrome b/b6 domain-containing protein [Litoreibacter halocynthiae]|uniref:cytochrome b/b6 domain-containing protein n=1 Tax=Litoreibacter halocynthiae TaxID=1242689 RepID=UPI0024929CAF|nr:cytochrome b/b6 domain-containing protein [Litoreibacter halocynthiae]